MTLASPQPNPDQLSYLDTEMKMTNGEAGWLSGEWAAGTTAEALVLTSLRAWAGERPALDQPLSMRKGAMGLQWEGRCQALSPPCAESDSFLLISRKGQELKFPRTSVAGAESSFSCRVPEPG